MEIRSDSPEKTKELAYQIAEKIRPKNILSLYGDLGAGKTTFVRYFAEALGSTSKVQSPTFVLHRRYKADAHGIQVINHIDLYRLSDQEAVNELGLQEVFMEDLGVTVIEWPEIIEGILPEGTIKVRFSIGGENLRIIDVQNIS